MKSRILVVYVPGRERFDGDWPSQRESMTADIAGSAYEALFFDGPIVLTDLCHWTARQKAAFDHIVLAIFSGKIAQVWCAGRGISDSAREILDSAMKSQVPVNDYTPTGSIMTRYIRMHTKFYTRNRYYPTLGVSISSS